MSAGGDALGDAIKTGIDVQAAIDATDRTELMRAMGNAIWDSVGGYSAKRTATAISYAAATDDYIIGVTNTAATRTITLPTSQVSISGRVYIVSDESGNADAFPIQLVGQGGELIDGEAVQEIRGYESISVYATGTAWKVY